MGSVGDVLSNLDAFTFLIFIISLLVGYYVYTFTTRLRGLPPGPMAFPVVGNLPQLVMGQRRTPLMYELFEEYRAQYGDMFRLSLGSKPMVIVMGKDLVRQILVTKGQLFLRRPGFYLVDKVFQGLGVVFSNGRAWKEMRRFTLSSMRDFGLGKKSLEERVQDEARIVMDEMERQKKSFFPKRVYLNAISNIICGIVFGNRFEYNDPDFQTLLDCLEYLGQNAGIQMPENILPILAHIPGLSKVRVILSNDQKLRRYVRGRIAEHRTTYDRENIRDFLDLYLRTTEEGAESDIITEENVFRTIVDLFSAGSETTATSMHWLTLYMCMYPDVQKKCQQEIDRIVGSGRMVSQTDRNELVYVMSTIQEVQRIANVVSNALPRENTEDVELGGYLLPKGTMIIPEIRSIHMDPNEWPEPEVFRPERWIDDAGKVRKSDSFMPFSAGPRNCLGESLARTELFLFFSNILQRLTLRLPDGVTPPDLSGYQRGVVHHPFDYDVVVTRR